MQKQYVPPISETEKDWQNMGRDFKFRKYRIGRDDDFLNLGTFINCCASVKSNSKRVSSKIEIRDIFEHTTIASLSAYIDKLIAVNHDREEQEIQVLKVVDKESYQLSSAQKESGF